MKSRIVTVLIATMLVYAACRKNDTQDNRLGIDTGKYESILAADYSDALQNHNALKSAYVGITSHPGSNIGLNDTLYYERMFNLCDSLFSEDFFSFSSGMIRNGGFTGAGYGMMGGYNGHMGGSGGMMSSNNSGINYDADDIISYMNSIHNQTLNLIDPDYQVTDSLMYSQLVRCGMLSNYTSGIETVFRNMQELRADHWRLHGN